MLQLKHLFLPAVATFMHRYTLAVFPNLYLAGIRLGMNLHADLQWDGVGVRQHPDTAHAVHRGETRPCQVDAFGGQWQKMLLLDEGRRADALVSSGDAPLLVAAAVVEQTTVQRGQIDGARHRHPVVPAEVARLSFHAALLMPFGRRAELAVEAPVRPECDKARRLFPAL